MWKVIVTAVGLAGLTAIAYKRVKSRAILTPEKREEYHNAMNNMLDAVKLRELASKFHGDGLHIQGDMLEKRARLREMSKDQKRARKNVYRKALECTDKDKVLHIAELFENDGATGCAAELRSYADTLQ